MPRIRFTEVFNWHVRHNVTVSYKAGHEYLVTQRCAVEAITKGKAVEVSRLPVRRIEQDAGR